MTPPSAAPLLASSIRQPKHSLVVAADALRLQVNGRLNPKRRSELGQFMTPAPVASLMASMISELPEELRLLDAGAGVGSLTAAAIAELLARPSRPESIHVTAFEVDPIMIEGLRKTLSYCADACTRDGIAFTSEVREEDFLHRAADWLGENLFSAETYPRFDVAIQNPPYKKMHSASSARSLTRTIGVETTNLYLVISHLTRPPRGDGAPWATALCAPAYMCGGLTRRSRGDGASRFLGQAGTGRMGLSGRSFRL